MNEGERVSGMWEGVLQSIFFILTVLYVFGIVFFETKYVVLLFLLMIYFGVKSLTYYNWKDRK